MVKDLSGLRDPGQGFPPDEIGRYGQAAGRAWLARYEERNDSFRAQVADTPFRGSDAGGCLRQAHYKQNEIPKTNPPTAAEAYRMQLGTLVHDEFEPLLAEQLEALGFEVTMEPEYTIDGLVSGRSDMYVKDPKSGWSTIIELKTSGGYQYKKLACWFDGPPGGPKPMHVRQTALAAKALQVEEFTVVYLATELISPRLLAQLAAKSKVDVTEFNRFTSEFTIGPDEFLPIAEDEIRRMTVGAKAIEAGVDMPRIVLPEDDPLTTTQAVITNPRSGTWEVRSAEDEIVDAGEYWLCSYCDWRDQCIADAKA